MRGANRVGAIGLVCCVTVLLGSCESSTQPASKHNVGANASRLDPEVQGKRPSAPLQGPAELAAEGVSITTFTTAQESALYVTMAIEGMEVGGDGYDITPSVAGAALAGKEFRIPSDTKARWGLIDLTKKGPDANFIFTHRIGPSGASYSMRHYNCDTEQVRYLATGETIAQMRASKADEKMSDIVPESIAYYLGRLACTDMEA